MSVTTTHSAKTGRRRRKVGFGFDRFSGLYLWAIFIVTFGIWEPHLFLSIATLHSVVANQAMAGIMALAVLVPLSCGAYDLSVGAVANLSTVVAISLQSSHHWAMAPAIACAIVVSMAAGVVNGLAVVKFKINSFIVTLGTATVYSAVQGIVSSEQQPNPPTSTLWGNLTQATVGGFEVIIIYLIVIAVILWWVLEHTPAGRYIYATGGNPAAARLAGVKVDFWTFIAFVVSATLAGIVGVLYGSLYGPALTYGQALLLPAFAAAFLGSTQLKRGRYNVWGSLLAVYVLATGVEGLSLLTGVQWLNDMFDGVALVVAVGFAGWRQRMAVSFRLKGAGGDDGAVPPTPDAPPPLDEVGELRVPDGE